MTDTIRAGVYGHLVGDAIGMPYDSTPYKSCPAARPEARTNRADALSSW